jgi:hypothetical protein
MYPSDGENTAGPPGAENAQGGGSDEAIGIGVTGVDVEMQGDGKPDTVTEGGETTAAENTLTINGSPNSKTGSETQTYKSESKGSAATASEDHMESGKFDSGKFYGKSNSNRNVGISANNDVRQPGIRSQECDVSSRVIFSTSVSPDYLRSGSGGETTIVHVPGGQASLSSPSSPSSKPSHEHLRMSRREADQKRAFGTIFPGEGETDERTGLVAFRWPTKRSDGLMLAEDGCLR